MRDRKYGDGLQNALIWARHILCSHELIESQLPLSLHKNGLVSSPI